MLTKHYRYNAPSLPCVSLRNQIFPSHFPPRMHKPTAARGFGGIGRDVAGRRRCESAWRVERLARRQVKPGSTMPRTLVAAAFAVRRAYCSVLGTTLTSMLV